MEFGSVTTSPESLTAYLESVSFDAWKKLDGDASAISICSISAPTPLIMKGDHMTRLAYPIRTNYMRGGKVRVTFAVQAKTASAMIKLENSMRDRIGASGMMKKTEIKQMFQSCVHGPTAKYPSHTIQLEMRLEAPKTSLYAQVPRASGSGWDTDPVDYESIAKFSLMSLRIAPTLLWKGNGKCSIKFQVKQAIVAHEDEIPPPVDEVPAHIDVQWDDLDNEDFMQELASAGSGFVAEKLVPKGLKAVKGAVKAPEDELVTTSKPKAEKKLPAKKKASALESNDDESKEEEEETVVAFGLASSPPPAAKKPVPKRPKKSVKTIEPTDIPEGKVELPPSAYGLDDETLEAMGDESEES